MTVKTYFKIWVVITAILCYEYFCLNLFPEKGMLHHFGLNPSPEPGRSLSTYLGWFGMGLMVLMNVYTLRKKSQNFAKLGGSLSAWLNFHIFCGVVGPTFIVFHSNFKVRGLVAISFWSMLVAATSGIVGRYFYTQLLKKKSDLKEETRLWETELQKLQISVTPPIAEERLKLAKSLALRFVGVDESYIGADGTIQVSAVQVFWASVVGDFRLRFDLPRTLKGLPSSTRKTFRDFALAKRRSLFLEPFSHLMGYWHAFHLPFAIFMYIAAVIHIATALILGVGR